MSESQFLTQDGDVTNDEYREETDSRNDLDDGNNKSDRDGMMIRIIEMIEMIGMQYG